VNVGKDVVEGVDDVDVIDVVDDAVAVDDADVSVERIVVDVVCFIGCGRREVERVTGFPKSEPLN
jgi:hypothetical protein